MMDGNTRTSRYVELRKAQVCTDTDNNVEPGELNQAIPTSQLCLRKCNECGQILPEGYQTPLNEPWSSGIFGCTQDTQSCWTGLFCPCVLFGRNMERMGVEIFNEPVPWVAPCICHAVCVEGGMALAVVTALTYGIDPEMTRLLCLSLFGTWLNCGVYIGLARRALQRKYHLKNSPCEASLVHCCMHWCALCQEHRELKSRLPDATVMPRTVVNPPPAQAMTGRDNQQGSTPISETTKWKGKGVATIEMQAL